MAKGILKVLMVVLSMTVQMCIELFKCLTWLLEQALRLLEKKTP
jgi:hypothetical protein